VARAHATERCANAAVHTFGCAPDFNDAPEGDDMTASASIATAPYEELAAAVRGETAGAQAAIVIVSREPGAREILNRELSKRRRMRMLMPDGVLGRARARRAFLARSRLSDATHPHPYELAPAADELRRWHSEVTSLVGVALIR
jgi:hypothetical protein